MTRVVRGVRVVLTPDADVVDPRDVAAIARASDLARELGRGRDAPMPAGHESRSASSIVDPMLDVDALTTATTAMDERRERAIAETRAVTTCDRETAALAVDLGEACGWDGGGRADFARASRELALMGFDDDDGRASGALGVAGLRVERAVVVCLARERS